MNKKEPKKKLSRQGVPEVIKGLGNLSIYKGKIDGVQLAIFDAIPTCTDMCEFYEHCPQVESYDSMGERCQLRVRYLQSVFGSLTASVEKKDHMTMHKIGLMLIPLYSYLVSFKIKEHTMNLTGNVAGVKGRISPVYKEIRETIKLINSLLKEIAPSEIVKGNNTLVNGNSSYYDDMLKDALVIDP